MIVWHRDMDETCCAVSNPPRSLQYALVRRAMQSFQRPNQRTLRSLCNTWQSHITGKTRRPLAQWEAVEVDEVARIDRNLYLDPPDTSKSLGTTSCGIASSMVQACLTAHHPFPMPIKHACSFASISHALPSNLSHIGGLSISSLF